jgi:hypothetical protein
MDVDPFPPTYTRNGAAKVVYWRDTFEIGVGGTQVGLR